MAQATPGEWSSVRELEVPEDESVEARGYMIRKGNKEENRASKYISFREIPALAKTRRWWVLGKDGKAFGIIKWYGGWRKYVVYLEGDSFFDQDGMRLISDFLEKANREHGAMLKGRAPSNTAQA